VTTTFCKLHFITKNWTECWYFPFSRSREIEYFIDLMQKEYMSSKQIK
jgi:hypothetical protein